MNIAVSLVPLTSQSRGERIPPPANSMGLMLGFEGTYSKYERGGLRGNPAASWRQIVRLLDTERRPIGHRSVVRVGVRTLGTVWVGTAPATRTQQMQV